VLLLPNAIFKDVNKKNAIKVAIEARKKIHGNFGRDE